jgi:hypothetical protein
MQQSAPARSGGDITTASHHPRAAGPSRQSRGATSAVGLTPRRRCPREGLARPAERWESRRRLGPGTTALLPRCPSSRGLLGRATNHGGTVAACSPLLGQAVASTGTAGQPPGEPREPQGKQGRGSPPGTQKPEAVVTRQASCLNSENLAGRRVSRFVFAMALVIVSAFSGAFWLFLHP